MTTPSNPRETTEDDRAIIVIGGHPPDRRVLGHLPTTEHIICADSGLDHALRLGLVPSVVIGDFDSVDSANLTSARTAGCTVIEHRPDKDATDTELALIHATDRGFRHLTVIWGGGDRIDHVLGVMAALGHRRMAALDTLRLWLASDRLDIVHSGHATVDDPGIGTTISILPLGPEQCIVSSQGLKWNLQSDTIESDSARGVSNIVTASPYQIRTDNGAAAVVLPGYLGREIRSHHDDVGGRLEASR